MDKFSIINSAKMISEARGDEADAILICRINDGESQISIIGLNKDKTDAKAILMAESLVTLIKGDLSMAYKLNALFYNAGKARDEAEPEEDSVEDPEAKNTGKVFARELVDALLYSVFGGDSSNEDDA